MLTPWKKSYDQPRPHIKKQTRYFANKGPCSQRYGFSGSHVWMWEMDYNESWVPKNECFWTVMLEQILESPLDCKDIQLVHLKGNQSWMFIGRTDAEAKTPILWPPDAKNWLIWKDPNAGKDWRQKQKRMTGWDVWIVSLTWWAWVWVSSRSGWWTGKPGLLQSLWLQRVRHDWETELNLIQAHLVVFVLCFIADIMFFTNWTYVATSYQISLSVAFFQQHLVPWCLCVMFLIILIIFLFFHYFLCVLWCSGFNDLWRDAKNHAPYKVMSLVDQCYLWSDCSKYWPPSQLLLFTILPVPWDTSLLKLDQLITLHIPLSV